jgi:hypothetical protein
MANRASIVKAVLRGAARMNETYTIQAGPLRATGVPAILVGAAGIVLASGVTALLSRAALQLPETLREARGLAETLRDGRPRLNP